MDPALLSPGGELVRAVVSFVEIVLAVAATYGITTRGVRRRVAEMHQDAATIRESVADGRGTSLRDDLYQMAACLEHVAEEQRATREELAWARREIDGIRQDARADRAEVRALARRIGPRELARHAERNP